jgi:hypothetical protein
MFVFLVQIIKEDFVSDYKSAYSEASQYYIDTIVPNSSKDSDRYLRSKAREEQYNDRWMSHSVNLNKICDKFAPGDAGSKIGHPDGVKYVFKGSRYKVVADMASGYLRIQNLASGKYVKLDGRPGVGDETHFKILRREEM